LVSEYNYTHLPGIVDGKKSYIVDCTATSTTIGVLKCVIDGYYFEISNILLEKSLTLYISVNFTELVKDGTDTRRDLHYLSVINIESYNFTDTTSTALDNRGVTTLAEDKFEYYFRGLAYSTESSPAGPVRSTATLQVTDSYGNLIPENDIRNFASLYVGTDANKTARRTSMTNVASGLSSVALGSHTKATSTGQVAVGSHNKEDNEAVFIIGDGDSTNPHNVLVAKPKKIIIDETLQAKKIEAEALEIKGTNLIETSVGTINRVTKLEADVNGLTQTITETKTELGNTSSTVSTLTHDITGLKAAVQNTQTDIGGITETLTQFRVENGNINTSIESLTTRADGTDEKFSTLNQTVDGFKTQVSSAQTNATSALTKASTLEQTVEGFKTEVSSEFSNVDGKIEEARSSFEQTAQGITGRLESIEGDTEELTQRVGDLEITAGGITAEFVENAVSDGIENSQKILNLRADVDEVSTKLTSAEGDISELKQTATDLTSKFTSAEGDVSELKQTVEEIAGKVGESSFQLTEEEFNIRIKSAVQSGAERVYTSEKNYSFDNAGLNISSSDNSLSTVIDEDGMDISRNGQLVLVANNEGVRAEDLHATTYLIIGANSRLENFTNEAGNTRTACFWIGG
jgi:predicted  nucleic acid-binding Zn-ribbon protein